MSSCGPGDDRNQSAERRDARGRVSHAGDGILTWHLRILVITYLVVVGVACANARAAVLTPRAYAHQLVLHRWHSQTEWWALDAIVTPESSWNPCASYPGRHDCGYTGSSSCGIPQANPCPVLWRGRLWSTRFAQVRWVIGYVGARYGSPSRALAWRRAHGWY